MEPATSLVLFLSNEGYGRLPADRPIRHDPHTFRSEAGARRKTQGRGINSRTRSTQLRIHRWPIYHTSCRANYRATLHAISTPIRIATSRAVTELHSLPGSFRHAGEIYFARSSSLPSALVDDGAHAV